MLAVANGWSHTCASQQCSVQCTACRIDAQQLLCKVCYMLWTNAAVFYIWQTHNIIMFSWPSFVMLLWHCKHVSDTDNGVAVSMNVTIVNLMGTTLKVWKLEHIRTGLTMRLVIVVGSQYIGTALTIMRTDTNYTTTRSLRCTSRRFTRLRTHSTLLYLIIILYIQSDVQSIYNKNNTTVLLNCVGLPKLASCQLSWQFNEMDSTMVANHGHGNQACPCNQLLIRQADTSVRR